MEKRNEAQDLYCQTRLEKGEEKTVMEENMNRVRHLILQFLIMCRPENRFQFPEFSRIIEISSSLKDFNPEKASVAFQNIEIYLILILQNPWKPEFQNIRKYGGYFQSKIEAHLKGAEEVFKFIGYNEKHNGVLTVYRRPTKEIVLAVAFECLVASVECTIVDSVSQGLRNEGSCVSYIDIVKYRQKSDGNIQDTIHALRSEQRTEEGSKFKTGNSCSPYENATVGRSYKKDITFPVTAGSASVPFIDEDSRPETLHTDYQEGTLDDHLMASLRLVSKEKAKEPDIPKVNKGSEEWSFVRDSLRDKYGEKYFYGQRGDLLKDEDVGISSGQVIHERITSTPGKDYKTVDKMKSMATSQRDSGYVGSNLSQQRVFYPPEHLTTELTARAGSTFSNVENLSPIQEGKPKAWASAQLSTIDPSQLNRSLQFPRKTASTSLDSSRQNSTSYIEQREQNFPSSRRTAHNFSHSAPVVRKEFVNSNDSWVCSHCTSMNASKSTVCDMCSKSRNTIVSDSLSTSRICRVCTLENQPGNRECEACGTSLSGLQTNV